MSTLPLDPRMQQAMMGQPSQRDLLMAYYMQQAQQQQPQQGQSFYDMLSNKGGQKGTGKLGDKIAELLGLGGKEASGIPADAIGQNIDGSYIMPEAAPGLFSGVGPMAGSVGGAGALAGIAAGVGLGAKGAKDLMSGKKTKGWEGWGGRATLGIATGGLSEVARLAGVGKKSTKDYQKERRDKVVSQGNTSWQDFFSKNKQDDGSGKWTDGIGAGKKWNWKDAVERAKVNPSEFAGVQGNADTFGDDWFSLDDAKRDELVSRMVNENLYHSDKGSILISDKKKDRAKELFNEVTSSGYKPTIKPQAILHGTRPAYTKPSSSWDSKPSSSGSSKINMSEAQFASSPSSKPAANTESKSSSSSKYIPYSMDALLALAKKGK